MKRFILPLPPDKGGLLRLSGRDYHYLVRVRRLGPGASFPALLPSGEEAVVEVQAVDGGFLTGRCRPRMGGTEDAGVGEGALPPLILFQALPKGAKMDLILRQAAEGGLAEVAPFMGDHTVPRLKPDSGGDKRMERWRRILKEALQQSGSGIATALRSPCSEEALLDYWQELRERCPRALGLLMHQDPLEKGSLHGYLGMDPELVVFAVGPEGGFSPEETGRFIARGFRPVCLGNTVFRTETAALYSAAAVRTILLERASWLPKIPAP
jgi:16S rRNA (uracil1498-N3)-methyltransferase